MEVLDTFSVSFACYFPVMLYIICPAFIIYLLTTTYWYIACIYLFWAWIWDRNIAEKGGREFKFLRNSKMYKYVRDYYPVKLEATPGFKLDPKRNYLCCTYPHGIMPIGTLTALATNACEVDKIIPKHKINFLTLASNFIIPLYRDYLMACGICSVSLASINYLLRHPNGGRIAGLVIGGAAEAMLTAPGVYKIVLKNRKGFAKIALRNGSPLIPVFSFGEVDILKQKVFAKDSLMGRLQVFLKDLTGIHPTVLDGKGIYRFIPKRVPVNVVLGIPIDVVKNDNPSAEDVDALHSKFVEALKSLFEEYKYKYVSDPENTSLIIT